MTAEPDHQQCRDAVAAWWNARKHVATWDPQQGVTAFTEAFDPDHRLPPVQHLFTPQGDGDLLITWAGRYFRIRPGETFTYRPRATRTGGT